MLKPLAWQHLELVQEKSIWIMLGAQGKKNDSWIVQLTVLETITVDIVKMLESDAKVICFSFLYSGGQGLSGHTS